MAPPFSNSTVSPTATFVVAGVKLLSPIATVVAPPAGAAGAVDVAGSSAPPQAAIPSAAAARAIVSARLTMYPRTPRGRGLFRRRDAELLAQRTQGAPQGRLDRDARALPLGARPLLGIAGHEHRVEAGRGRDGAELAEQAFEHGREPVA